MSVRRPRTSGQHRSRLPSTFVRCAHSAVKGASGISNWSDLVDFEVTPVLTSAEFWAQRVKS